MHIHINKQTNIKTDVEDDEPILEGAKENNSMLKNQQAAPIQDLGLRSMFVYVCFCLFVCLFV
jgi:hypothetical protein